MNKAVFLDRDGVINRLIERKDGSLTSPWICSEFSFLPDVATAIQKLLYDNFKVFVISNQPGIFYGDQDLRELMKMDRILDSLGIHDRIYNLFPTSTDEDYKPGNAAFEKLIKQYDIDRTISYAIGDRWKDIVPANKSGLFSIFLGHTYSCPESMGYGLNSHPNKVCANLLEAVNFIMSNEISLKKVKVSDNCPFYIFNGCSNPIGCNQAGCCLPFKVSDNCSYDIDTILEHIKQDYLAKPIDEYLVASLKAIHDNILEIIRKENKN